MNLFNVIICDDHHLSALGVEIILRKYSMTPLNIRTATTGKMALAFFSEQASDLIITDLGLPDISGMDVIKKIRDLSPESKIIALTGQDSPDLLKQVYNLKVNGIIRKMSTSQNLIDALNFIKNNGEKTFIDPSVESILQFKDDSTPTRREFEVLDLMSKGHTSDEIASELNCSLATIKTYRARIMNKSNARNSAEMIAWYLKRK